MYEIAKALDIPDLIAYTENEIRLVFSVDMGEWYKNLYIDFLRCVAIAYQDHKQHPDADRALRRFVVGVAATGHHELASLVVYDHVDGTKTKSNPYRDFLAANPEFMADVMSHPQFGKW